MNMFYLAGGAALVAYFVFRGKKRPRIEVLNGCDVRGHARRIQEGYVLSGIYEQQHVQCLKDQGIKLVVSAYGPDDATRAELQRQGIARLSAPMSSTWRHSAEIVNAVYQYSPDEVLIHCNHGADRTGNITAFLLVLRHGWSVPDAFYSVVNPSSSDVEGLNMVLREYGYPGDKGPNSPGVGIYSVTAIGKSGGMKARNDDYRRMIRGNIESLRSYGVQ